MYNSDVEPPDNDTDNSGGNTTDLAAVFDHKDVLSFGCEFGFRAKDKPPQGQTFHTLKCSKGEWKGLTPVCDGRQPYALRYTHTSLTVHYISIKLTLWNSSFKGNII